MAITKAYLVYVSTLIVFLSGCASSSRTEPNEVKSALNQAINSMPAETVEVPDAVTADLMPAFNDKGENTKTHRRFRVQAQDVDASAFFASLVQGTEYSVAIHPEVTGQITVSLNDVTLDEVLGVLSNLYGYEIDKVGKVIQVFPIGLRTETFPVDYLQFQRSGRSLTSITTGTVSNTDSSGSTSSGEKGGTEIETVSESDFWPQLQTAISQVIGNDRGQSVVVSPQSGVVTVRAFPPQLREVKKFLGVSHQRMHRQVILEAKILEVTLKDGYQQGIDWSKAFTSNGTNYSFGQGSITKDSNGNVIQSPLAGLDSIGTLLGGAANLVISSGSFDAVLSFISTQGDLNVLSSPRVTASNNQKSVIKVGSDEYFVTDLSGIVGNGDNSQVTPEVELTPFFSGIALDVTPQIDDNGGVMLHVHPAVIQVEEQSKEITYNGGTIKLPLAVSSIRESDSVIRAQNGDVVVIGGLMKTSTFDQTSKVPLLGDVPGVGQLFRHVSQVTEKTELVILLKPTIVGADTWQQELKRSQSLLNEWFPEE